MREYNKLYKLPQKYVHYQMYEIIEKAKENHCFFNTNKCQEHVWSLWKVSEFLKDTPEGIPPEDVHNYIMFRNIPKRYKYLQKEYDRVDFNLEFLIKKEVFKHCGVNISNYFVILVDSYKLFFIDFPLNLIDIYLLDNLRDELKKFFK